MHHIYNTECFVICSYDIGESSKKVVLFSRELGLVVARAQNSRSISSKLRYSIQDFSFGKFSLVRGKGEWKLVGVDNVLNFVNGIDDEKVKILARIFNMIKKFTGEEDKNHKIFDMIFDFAGKIKSFDDSKLKSAECILVMKILNELGFLKSDLEFKTVLDNDVIEKKDVDLVHESVSNAISLINDSIKFANI